MLRKRRRRENARLRMTSSIEVVATIVAEGRCAYNSCKLMQEWREVHRIQQLFDKERVICVCMLKE